MKYDKKWERNPAKRQNCGFLPLSFPNSGHLEWYTPINGMRFLEFLVENKAFYFSKVAFCAGIARNKWLKNAVLKIAHWDWHFFCQGLHNCSSYIVCSSELKMEGGDFRGHWLLGKGKNC